MSLNAERKPRAGHLHVIIRQVRVRILKQPHGTVDGVSLEHYHAGCFYDLPPNLAAYLVVEGFAAYEMRKDGVPRPPETERRKKKP